MSHISTLLVIFTVATLALVSSIHASYHAHSFQETSDGFQLQLDLMSSTKSSISTPIQSLILKGQYWRDDVFRMSIRDRQKARWEVPHVLLPKPDAISEATHSKRHTDARQYSIDFQSSPFSLTVLRNSDNLAILNLTSLIFNDQYIEVQTSLNVEDPQKGPHIYGFGERVHNFRLNPLSQTYTLWAFDHGTPVDQPLYGSHPFHTQMYNGKFHGTFMLNSNAMDVILEPRRLTYKMIGGIVDLFVFVGSTAEQVVQQYQQAVIGTPKMVPFWTLGNHQCRWGYKSIAELEGVINKYASLGIPVDTAWSDIDWMDSYRDFDPDPINYNPKDVQAFMGRMRQNDRHYVVILDPGIKILEGYKTYEEGLQQNVFVRSAVNGGKPLVAEVWPGKTLLPDWTAPNTFSWWKQQISRFMAEYPVDGLWIDMNEPSNFLQSGECFMQPDMTTCNDRPAPEHTPAGQFDPNYPPYLPGNMNLVDHTISLDAVHNTSIEYNIHTMYGFYEAMATQPALESVTGKRSFVLSRSTYPGSGRYTQHWLGDNNSEWSDLFYSISGILNFQMYGIPFVGVDICGFGGNTNAELCARWVQLGSFYPFTRNHNAINSNPQEYYVFGDKVVAIARSSLLTKYSLLSYYYTLLHKSSKVGGTVLRPVVFEFPTDTEPTVPFIDRQFFVGSALMVLPVLDQGANAVTAYVPGMGKEQWYDFFSGESVNCQGYCKFDAPLERVNVLVRGGHSILLHKVEEGNTTTTAQARRDGFRLLVALDGKQESSGDIYIDDGESINVEDDFIYASFQHRASGSSYTINSQAVHPGKLSNMNTQLKELVVYGIQRNVTALRVGGRAVSSFKFDSQSGVLTADISSFDVDIQKIDVAYDTQS